MLNPSELEMLAIELVKPAYDGLGAEATANALTVRPMIPNPESAPQVSQPFTLAEIASGIADLGAVPAVVRVKAADIVTDQDHVRLHNVARAAFSGGDAASLVALADRVQDDPGHPTQVSSDCRLEELGLGGAVTHDEVEQARAL